MATTPTEEYGHHPTNYTANRNDWESKQWWEKQDEAGAHADAQLRDAESGKSSIAQQQLRSGMAQAQRAQMGMAAGRGSNPLAQRAAMYSGGQMQSQMGGQAAALRAQEMQAAHAMKQQQLQQYAAGIQGYDSMAAEGAMQSAANELTAAQQRQDAHNKAQERAIQWGGVVAGAMSDERSKVLDTRRDEPNYGQQSGGGLGSKIGFMSALSDERSKQNGASAVVGSMVQPTGMAARVAQIASAYEELDRETTARLADETRDYNQLATQLDASDAEVSRRLGVPEQRQFLPYVPERQTGYNALAADLDAEGAKTSAALQRPPPDASLSDERSKVEPGPEAEADETMRALQAHRYQYRPEFQAQGAPPGERAGIMAQDLEQTPLGEGAVVEDERGVKYIDVPQTASLAAGLSGRAGRRLDSHALVMSDLHRRLARIEGRKV